jgi:hypothetical protein
LQAALNAAQPGDTILLQAGAVFTGGFKLPVKSGSGVITVRSSAPDSSLPPAGTRITPAYSSKLAKIRLAAGGWPGFRTSAGTANWRLMFLEVYPSASNVSSALVELGVALSSQSTLAAVPQHIVIDRCYLHGDASFGQRRGIALNSGDTQIINSYLSDFKATLQDTQAIGGWNGPGPFLIENNYIEASGENIMFGGSDPNIPNLVPSNITIRRNLIAKPLSWMSKSWTIKNLIELKNAQNVTIEGNTIEGNWSAGQQGYAIVLTPRNQSHTAPWSVVKNITVRNNIIRHVAAAFNICGYDNLAPSQQTSNIKIINNLAYDVSTKYSIPNHPANGIFVLMGAGPKDIVIDHNTVDNDGHQTISFYKGASPTGTLIYGFQLTNNLLRDNLYGIMGASSQEGTVTLNAFAPNADVRANAIAGANPKLYPTGNDYPSLTQWLADFVGRATGNYQLLSSSLSNNAGTDGKDIGVDFAALTAAMNGSGGADPGPGDPPDPPGDSTPYTGSPVSIPGTIQMENYDAGGEGVAYHDGTSGNSGGVYRSNSVDIQATTDAGGGYNIGWTTAGEWLKYGINVKTAGTYTMAVRVASNGTGGRLHIEVNGADKTGSLSVPNTGGWQVWKTITKTGVALGAGPQLVRVVMDANGPGGSVGNVNWVGLTLTSGAPPSGGSTPFTGAAIALPGTIQTENYDKGGEGVAYHDTTPGNSGGAYRSDDVDVKTTTDSSGGTNIKSVRASEWLAYSVSVANAGTYTAAFRVASSGTGGTVHLTLDGANITSAITLPDTGGWNSWRTITKTGVALPAGKHVLKLVVDANGSGGTVADVNWITFSSGSIASSTPYTGSAVALPGTVEAENYDGGGKLVAYNDTTSGNSGGVYRSNNVDIQATSDSGRGYNIGWTKAGEWLKYTVNVAKAAVYAMDFRVASSGAGGTFHVEVNGVNKTGTLTIPNTGGWQAWKTITKTSVSLAAGLQVIRLVMDANGASGGIGNFNWIKVR